MKTVRIVGLYLVATAATAFVGCAASIPPPDLVNARNTYDRVSKGPAQQLDPADMHTAKVQLDAAEAAFAKDGDTQNTRDQAYVAVRKAELADVVAQTLQANRSREGVVSAMHSDQKKAVALTAAQLSQTKTQLDATGIALQGETLRREDAERRAAEASSALAKFATVKQETRGMVITLSGSVLFTSAKSELLPAAQVKLNDVANALTRQDPHSKMVVEGHTDSQGAAAYNQDLSQQRAQAVRDYLVTRGIASDRITAQGFGSTRSVAENASPEGRANNRRVEIVVQATPAP